MKKEKYNVAVVGATGAVGEQMREVLEEREFPVGELRLLASERSAGQLLPFQGKQLRVEVLNEGSFEGIDIGLFSAGGTVSAKISGQPTAQVLGAINLVNFPNPAGLERIGKNLYSASSGSGDAVESEPGRGSKFSFTLPRL